MRGNCEKVSIASHRLLASASLAGTNFCVAQTSLLTVAHWLLLFYNFRMGEEMVKFKAKKDSGKKVMTLCQSSLGVERHDILTKLYGEAT